MGTIKTIKVRMHDEVIFSVRVRDGESDSAAIERGLKKKLSTKFCNVSRDGHADFSGLPLFLYETPFETGRVVALNGVYD